MKWRSLCDKCLKRRNWVGQSGFTLVEVLAVIVIVSILAAIAVPAVGYLIEKTEADACVVNRGEIDRLYHEYLVLEGLEHSNVLFLQFLGQFIDTCPNGGSYSNVGEEVVCDLHGDGEEESDEDQSDDGGVPFCRCFFADLDCLNGIYNRKKLGYEY